jgi:cytochrome b subunit of formate dehydrogenase
MEETHAAPGAGTIYRRFDTYNRLLHGLLMFSFLGLAFTGMPLLFSDAPWAIRLADVFGGGHAAGILHRTFASLMITCFVLHVWRLMHRLYVKKELEVLWGPESMTPQPRDVGEMLAHLRWFLRLGPQPRFDHFTYWEKFDYWAVFWGMGVIGGSGLVLWFPEFFARFLPGSWFNIALLVHGEEGLLAVGFIFTIHFFNSHLRPDKFPMDPVIFTGRVTAHELQEERPAEYDRLRAARRLDEIEVGPAPGWVPKLAKGVAVVAVTLGLVMVGLIVFAVLIARL